MDVQIIQKRLEGQLDVIEGFLKTILLKKIDVKVSATSLSDPEMVIEALKTGTAVVGTIEKSFDTQIYIAFDDNWIPQLSMAMLGVEEHEVNEITRDLIKEFTAQLFGTIQTSLGTEDILVEPGEVELLKSAQIANSINKDEYFMAQIDVTGKFMIDGDEQPQLAMILAFAIPDEDKINEVLGLEEEPEPEPEPEISEVEEDSHADEVASTGEKAKANDEKVSDEDIEALLGGGAKTESSKAPVKPQSKAKTTKSGEEAAAISAEMKKEQEATRRIAKDLPAVGARSVDFDEFDTSTNVTSELEIRNLDMLKDVELDISVELGRKELPLGDVLHLVRGSVIELDKLAGEPVEIYANGHRIAEGEVVVIDEHFGVRITNLVSTRERIESLR